MEYAVEINRLIAMKWKVQLDNLMHVADQLREYVIGENQQQKYVFLIDDADAVHDMHLRFYVERNAALVIHLLIANTNARIKIDSLLCGEGAQVHVKGAYILSGEHAVSIDTFQHHQAAHTSSTLVMKGALRGKSHAHYCGTIRVERCAQGTYASQENKNMLLSNNARAISCPI